MPVRSDRVLTSSRIHPCSHVAALQILGAILVIAGVCTAALPPGSGPGIFAEVCQAAAATFIAATAGLHWPAAGISRQALRGQLVPLHGPELRMGLS